MGASMSLTSYFRPLAAVLSFKYLVRFMLALNDYWSSVIQNLQRARNKRVQMSQVLKQEGMDAFILGMFYIVAM